MARAKNILFIMFDQLRRDYLSCYGHPHLHTPHIDRLASMGVRFDRAYIQSPVCGSSRMSTYTGRYVHSHGASTNMIPLKVGEMTLGDHLRPLGMGTWLVGKTHMVADAEGMARLGLAPDSQIGARVAECGFDVFERDDGLAPRGPAGSYDARGARAYNEWLLAKGYESDNPWHDFANSALDENGNVLSGWFLKNSAHPANIAEPDSETPYLTGRGIEFMAQATEPWLCHLSYIKPHWPYIVPEPYASMYGPEHVLPPIRDEAELADAHPTYRAFTRTRVGQAFARDDVRAAVIPAYMGLIKQADDQMGRLFAWMEETGRMQDTMIVLTSDHGDFLGDHWLGEKTFFHDSSTRIPLIIYDPSPEADTTRGTVCDALVESIDLAPTFVEVAGGTVPDQVLEGRSLLPILHGQASDTGRTHVFCEYDYAATGVGQMLDADVNAAQMYMVADKRWKLIVFNNGERPMLFDLQNDPQELRDLGTSNAHAEVIAALTAVHLNWAQRPAQRTTRTTAQLKEMRTSSAAKGIVIGVGSPDEYPEDLTVHYRDRRVPHWTEIAGDD